MPFNLFEYQDMMHPMGASPIQCPDGAQPILTKYKDPKLENRDIGFGKGINGSFKCPPPNPCPLTTQTIKKGKTCNYSLNK